MSKKRLVFLAGVAVVSLVSAQNVYKWQDANGKVHYGDVPVESKSKAVDTRSPMQGSVVPTIDNKKRAEAYISEGGGGSGGAIVAPKPKSRCPYAR